MPQTILASLTSKPQFVATNENTGTQVWSLLGIVDVEVDSSSANSDAPVSSSQVSSSTNAATDASATQYQSVLSVDIQTTKIIQPSRLRVTALCSDLSTLENVISTFTDDTVTISINTKSIITSYLVLSDVEIEQTGEMISASKVIMTFEQAQPPQNSGFAPAQAADSSVYGVSLQNPPSVTPLSTLTKAVSSAAAVPIEYVSGALIDQAGGPFILDSSMLA
jgi:hypothetical protein